MNNNIHFVGIGGMGMSSLAQHFLCLGFDVSGSDLQQTPLTDKLASLGAKIYYTHSEKNIQKNCTLVVHTSAVGQKNCELLYAKSKNIPTLLREQMLGQIFNTFDTKIAVSGIHGKTTTTSMLDYILRKENFPHTTFVGGIMSDTHTNYTNTNASPQSTKTTVLAEACEYKKSFLNLTPNILIALNIEHDHPDFYKTPADMEKAFTQFFEIAKTNDGKILACGDCISPALLDGFPCLTFGENQKNFYSAKNITQKSARFSFDFFQQSTYKCHVDLKIDGKHNIQNALAALATCDLLGIDAISAATHLSNFTGTDRRMMPVPCPFTNVIEDYAHHPTEIKALIDTAKRMGYQKIYAVFQPHTYTRTKAFWKNFTTCFEGVDMLFLLPIYAAREPKIHGTTSMHLCRATNTAGITPCQYIETPFDAYCQLSRQAKKDDLVLIVGAGDIYQLSNLLTSPQKSAPN